MLRDFTSNSHELEFIFSKIIESDWVGGWYPIVDPFPHLAYSNNIFQKVNVLYQILVHNSYTNNI